MESILNPILLTDFDQYEYRNRGYSAEIFTNAKGVAIKLYEERFGIDTTLFEHNVLSHLKTTGIACPQLVDCVKVDDRWGFRYPWIEAETFKDAFSNRFGEMEQIANAFAQLHSTVHHIDGFDGLPTQNQYYRDIIADQPHLSGGEDARLLNLLSEMPNANKLCHGDFNPRNTLMDHTRGYAIDWQNAYCGSPLSDVAKTWVKLSFFAYHSQRTDETEKLWLRGYCRHYLNEYRRLNDFETDIFYKWIAIVAGIQSRSHEPPKRYWYSKLMDIYHDDFDELKKMVFHCNQRYRNFI